MQTRWLSCRHAPLPFQAIIRRLALTSAAGQFVVRALLGLEPVRERWNGVTTCDGPEAVDGARSSLAECGLELGEGLLDRVEVWRVWREIEQDGAGSLDRGAATLPLRCCLKRIGVAPTEAVPVGHVERQQQQFRACPRQLKATLASAGGRDEQPSEVKSSPTTGRGAGWAAVRVGARSPIAATSQELHVKLPNVRLHGGRNSRPSFLTTASCRLPSKRTAPRLQPAGRPMSWGRNVFGAGAPSGRNRFPKFPEDRASLS